MPGLGVSFGAKDTGLDAMTRKVAKTAGMLSEEYKKGARSVRALEAAGLRAFRAVESAGERVRRTQLGINQAVATGALTRAQGNRALTHATAQMRGQSALLSQLSTSAGSYLRGWLSIQAAMRIVTGSM